MTDMDVADVVIMSEMQWEAAQVHARDERRYAIRYCLDQGVLLPGYRWSDANPSMVPEVTP